MCPRLQRGGHVPHRQDALGELASRRRERGTVSTGPLTPVDHGSSKDVSTPCVPLLHDDASTKAALAFNSTPPFPRRDFGWGSLRSFCVYDLLETPRLLATPRPHGNRRSVRAWPAPTSFQSRTLDRCDLVSHLWLANKSGFQPKIRLLSSFGETGWFGGLARCSSP